MKYRVRTLRRADADIVSVEDYLGREAPTSAERVLDGIFDAIEDLQQSPERHAVARDERIRSKGFRVAVVAPYLIFFKVGRTLVRVYRVLHCKRSYRGLF